MVGDVLFEWVVERDNAGVLHLELLDSDLPLDEPLPLALVEAPGAVRVSLLLRLHLDPTLTDFPSLLLQRPDFSLLLQVIFDQLQVSIVVLVFG